MRVVVLGGGIAGLSAACDLARRGAAVTLVEAAPFAGGLASGFRERGYTFDLFSHRFWTRDAEVLALAESWVGAPLLTRRKVSRILLNGRLYNYPIDLRDLLSVRSGRLALRALAGYATARLGPAPAGDDFRTYLTARYGGPLFDTFFGPYTEKLTGCPASGLSIDLALGAVPGTGLLTQLLHRLIGRVDPWDDFLYPAGGFMALPEGMARAFRRAHGRLLLSHRLAALRCREKEASEVIVEGPGGRTEAIGCDQVISTVPLPALLRALDPPADPGVARAAARLRTRAMVTVYLGIARERLTEDHWIYVPDPTVRFNRLSETTNYSEGMAPPGRTGICAEIACDTGDAVWRDDDASQVERVISDLLRLGLLGSAREVEAAWVRRFASAYPVYTVGYRDDLGVVEDCLARVPSLSLCGRQGAFWYGSTAQGIRQALDVARDLDSAMARAA
jgi:protoporphyrinogen oxidase